VLLPLSVAQLHLVFLLVSVISELKTLAVIAQKPVQFESVLFLVLLIVKCMDGVTGLVVIVLVAGVLKDAIVQ
jgi:hypothetical protein